MVWHTFCWNCRGFGWFRLKRRVGDLGLHEVLGEGRLWLSADLELEFEIELELELVLELEVELELELELALELELDTRRFELKRKAGTKLKRRCSRPAGSADPEGTVRPGSEGLSPAAIGAQPPLEPSCLWSWSWS